MGNRKPPGNKRSTTRSKKSAAKLEEISRQLQKVTQLMESMVQGGRNFVKYWDGGKDKQGGLEE